jgi:hypothetical protein
MEPEPELADLSAAQKAGGVAKAVAHDHDETTLAGLAGPTSAGLLHKASRMGGSKLERFFVLNGRRLYYFDAAHEAVQILEYVTGGGRQKIDSVGALMRAARQLTRAPAAAFHAERCLESKHKGWLDLVGSRIELLPSEAMEGASTPGRVFYGFAISEEIQHPEQPMETMRLYAPSEESREEWILALREAARPTWLWEDDAESGMMRTVYSGLSSRGKEDTRNAACVACRKNFGLFKRRSHCRRCGGVMCKQCTDRGDLRHLNYDVPQKVCQSCTSGESASRFVTKVPKSQRCSATKSSAQKKAMDKAAGMGRKIGLGKKKS